MSLEQMASMFFLVVIVGLAFLCLVVRYEGDPDTYWLDDEPITRSEYEHLGGE